VGSRPARSNRSAPSRGQAIRLRELNCTQASGSISGSLRIRSSTGSRPHRIARRRPSGRYRDHAVGGDLPRGDCCGHVSGRVGRPYVGSGGRHRAARPARRRVPSKPPGRCSSPGTATSRAKVIPLVRRSRRHRTPPAGSGSQRSGAVSPACSDDLMRGQAEADPLLRRWFRVARCLRSAHRAGPARHRNEHHGSGRRRRRPRPPRQQVPGRAPAVGPLHLQCRGLRGDRRPGCHARPAAAAGIKLTSDDRSGFAH